jgi:hypothetical protein
MILPKKMPIVVTHHVSIYWAHDILLLMYPWNTAVTYVRGERDDTSEQYTCTSIHNIFKVVL